MRYKTIVLLLGVAVGITAVVAGSKTNEAVIRFSHGYHLDEVGAKCEDCHKDAANATESAADLLPKMESCYACHDQKTTECNVCHTEANVQDGKYSAYVASAREVVFSHQLHVTNQKIECLTCHGNVSGAKKAPSRGLPSMDVCVDCHHKRQISDNCDVCHSQVELRRPDDHGPDWVLDHVESARRDSKKCETCHRPTYCEECHDGAALGLSIRGKTGAPVDLVGPLAAAHEGKNLLIIQRRHDLNYRYSHGADVKSKTSDCGTCHETGSFCAACHNPENDGGRPKPVWHEVAGFGAGGKHAELARRDIEVCAACHDRDAAEPRCMQCHRTIVSPHADGFMKDVNGPWHDDNNAVCFVCHDAGGRHPGQGFCGRCHGEKVGD